MRKILTAEQVVLISQAVGPITAIDRDGIRVSAYELIDSHEILRAIVSELRKQLLELIEKGDPH